MRTVEQAQRDAWGSILASLEALEGAIGSLPHREAVDALRHVETVRDELEVITDRELVGRCDACETIILQGDDYVPFEDCDGQYCAPCGKAAIAAQQSDGTDKEPSE
jgi:hypothetical protein